MSNDLKYRPEIDGLRAIAILPVIFFHAGFSLFRGGHTGVDVFFVISGYLITSIISSEAAAGRFSILRFYERRARRILPALFLVLGLSIPAAIVWLFPDELLDFCKSLVAVVAFGSNFFFWRTESYFGIGSEFVPLLHTWSLAVEEQFYLFLPALLPLLLKVSRRFAVGLIASVTVVSVLFAQWASINMPTSNFYLLPGRAWELGIGCLIAFSRSPRAWPFHSRNFRQLASCCGVALIVGSVLTFDRFVPYPSVFALLPTVGAALIILFAASDTWVGRLLAATPLVRIGLISYGAYLFHQPVFAFFRAATIDEPGLATKFALCTLILVLAYSSWRFFETPIRSARFAHPTGILAAILGVALFAAIGLMLPKVATEWKYTEAEKRILSVRIDEYKTKTRAGRCLLSGMSQGPRAFAPDCKPDLESRPTVLVWGDSHAAALAVGFAATGVNLGQYTAAGCLPGFESRLPAFKFCHAINEYVLAEISRLRPEVVVVDADWLGSGTRGPKVKSMLEAIRHGSPKSKVLLIGNVPYWHHGLPQLMVKNKIDLAPNVRIRVRQFAKLMELDNELSEQAGEAGARFVSPLDFFCQEDNCLATYRLAGETKLAAIDTAHLTEAAAVPLARHILRMTGD